MKTTLDLPDDLMREVRIKAAEENRRLRDVVAELLRRGLAAPDEPVKTGHRVKLPLIPATGVVVDPAAFSPERIDAILMQEELERAGFGPKPL